MAGSAVRRQSRAQVRIRADLDLRVEAPALRRRFRVQRLAEKSATQPRRAWIQAVRRLRDPRQFDDLAALLVSIGSLHRLRILYQLLEAPAGYRELNRLTGLRAGPLYHHIHALRSAGLVGPKRRDLYQLSECGFQVAVFAALLLKIKRSRKVWIAF